MFEYHLCVDREIPNISVYTTTHQDRSIISGYRFLLPRSHSQQVAGCKSLYPGTAAKILTVTRRYGDMGLACAVSFPTYQNSVYWVWSSSVMGHTFGHHVQLGSPLGVPNNGISGKIQKLQRCQAGQILHDCLTGEMVHFSGPSHGTSFWGIIWNTLWSFNVADRDIAMFS